MNYINMILSVEYLYMFIQKLVKVYSKLATNHAFISNHRINEESNLRTNSITHASIDQFANFRIAKISSTLMQGEQFKEIHLRQQVVNGIVKFCDRGRRINSETHLIPNRGN